MKILLTGGGTGGHFYPLIAIAEKLNILAEEQKILNMKLYYMSNTPYDSTLLFENGITYVEVPAGKMRIYFSLRNIVDIFRAGAGAFWGLVSMFFIYPDVVISKGGYAAFPAVFAAKILRIPVVLHESDSVPGRLNTWTGRFAEKIAVSWPEAAQFFDTKKTAVTGQPIRRDILTGSPEGAHAYFNLDPAIPTIMVIGGSQGAEKINNAIIDILPELITRYQIIHQTGKIHFEDVSSRARFVTETSQYASRYHPVAYLHTLATRKAVGASSLVISRAGSALFEIASWGLPSIIIPIEHSHGNHQHKNAFTYARSGACEVIEEPNLTSSLLISLIDRIMSSQSKRDSMHEKARTFATPQASEAIARVALEIALSHEK